MVFALAGDSTTTTFIVVALLSFAQGASNGTSLTGCQERDAVAGMPLQASGQLEFQQRHPQKRRRQLTLPEQFVTRPRAGPEPAFDQDDGRFRWKIRYFARLGDI